MSPGKMRKDRKSKDSQQTVETSRAQEPTEQASSKVLDDITRSGLSTNVSSGSGNDQTFETKDNESPSSRQGTYLGTDSLCKSIDGDGINASKFSSARPEVGACHPGRLRRVVTGHTQERTWAQLASGEGPKVDCRNIFDEPKYGLFGTTKSAIPDRPGCLAKSEMLIQGKDGMKATSSDKEAFEGQLDTISFKTPLEKPMYTQSFGFSFSPKFEERPITVLISQTPSLFEDIEKQSWSSPPKPPGSAEGSKHHSRGCTMGLVQDFGPFPAAMKTSKETGDQPPILATPPVMSYLSDGMDAICGSIKFRYGESMESMFTESDDSSVEDAHGIYMIDNDGKRDCVGQDFTTRLRSKLLSDASPTSGKPKHFDCTGRAGLRM